MKLIHYFGLVLLVVAPISLGCGGSDENTVVQPTQDYQPTAEEQAMQAEMDAARE